MGIIDRIEPDGGLLMVNHKPLIPLLILKRDCLPVKIAYINISQHGISWLQTLVVGQKITFIPVLKNTEYIECEVNMLQKFHDVSSKNPNNKFIIRHNPHLNNPITKILNNYHSGTTKSNKISC